MWLGTLQIHALGGKSPPRVVNVGAFNAADLTAGGTLSVAYPSSIVAGNKLVLATWTKEGSSSHAPDPSVLAADGWTHLVNAVTNSSASLSVDSGAVNVDVYYKTATGSESGSYAVTYSGNPVTAAAQMVQLSSVGSFSGESGADNTEGTSFSVTASGAVAMASYDIVLAITGTNTDNNTYSTFDVSASGYTFGPATQHAQNPTSVGGDLTGLITEHAVASGAGTGTPTFTMTASGSAGFENRGATIFVIVHPL